VLVFSTRARYELDLVGIFDGRWSGFLSEFVGIFDKDKNYNFDIQTTYLGDNLCTSNYLVLEQPAGVIGRNILNRFNLNFNGPMTWDFIPG
jgi:hypothetical protein